MNLPTLVSGSPGTGKTTVTRLLASNAARGVHIETDVFFDFVPNLVDPSTPAAKAQNETIVRAYCSAAGRYAEEGFDVFVEGVIGPWMFPVILPVLGSFNYLLLTADHDMVRERVRLRTGQSSARSSVVDRMYPQFAGLLDAYKQHVVDTNQSTVDQVVAIIGEKVHTGECIVQAATR